VLKRAYCLSNAINIDGKNKQSTLQWVQKIIVAYRSHCQCSSSRVYTRYSDVRRHSVDNDTVLCADCSRHDLLELSAYQTRNSRMLSQTETYQIIHFHPASHLFIPGIRCWVSLEVIPLNNMLKTHHKLNPILFSCSTNIEIRIYYG